MMVCLALLPGSSFAAPSNDALTLGREALELYNQQRWVDSLERFERAEASEHSPVFVLYLARCKRQLGRYVEARDDYDRVLAETLADGAPEPWRNAQRDAEAERPAAADNVALLSIVLPPDAGDATVTVDGHVVPGATLARVEIDPGMRSIKAVRPDGVEATARIEAQPGGNHAAELSFPAIAGPPPQPGPPPPQPLPPPLLAADAVPGPLWPSLVSFGVAAGGLALGIGAGVTAVSDADALKAHCFEGNCPPEREAERDDVTSIANASTAGFVVAGVAAAAGVTLLVIRPGGTSLGIGASSLHIRGAF